MKIKTLTAALICAVPVSGAFAAALDRSGQSIAPFLQPGNYAEAGFSVLSPDVSGKEAGSTPTTRKVDDMGKDYFFGTAALKLQPTSQFSVGLIFDQPFGADAAYNGNNVFVSDASNTILPPERLKVIRQGTIDKNIAQVLPNAISTNLPLLLPGAVNQGVTSQAQKLIASGAVPAGTPIALVEAGIRNNPTAMQQIQAGAQAAVENGIKQKVTNEVTSQVDQGLARTNSLLGKGATNVKVTTEALTLLLGYQPTENWNFYAGPVYQSVKGNVSLRGQAYSLFNGYDANIPKAEEWGWLAGLSYQIPEIALKTSLTYRSKIDYDIDLAESIPTLPALALLGDSGAAAASKIAAAKGTTKITTPQSVNLDLQSGIMADTIAFANIRWVNWKDFSIQPYKFGLVSNAIGSLVNRPNGFDLVSYSKDQWSVNAGLGRKFSEKWSGSVSAGWDSGAGNPVTTLGPTEGYWNAGLGFQYSPAANYFVQGGVKYFWLGDAKAQTGAQAGGDDYVAKFEGNNALAYGLKVGYRF